MVLYPLGVILTKAGIHSFKTVLDSGLRRGDRTELSEMYLTLMASVFHF